jgi:hypothetical protein
MFLACSAAQRCALSISLNAVPPHSSFMSNKILVCALCSQDFTRRYSADRHNQNLHHGQGKIVRMIDYVIGRIAGEYNAANPLAYRTSYKQRASSSAGSDAKAFSFHSSSIAHDGSKGNSSSALSHINENVPNQQPSTNSVRPSTNRIIGATLKVEEIVRLIRSRCAPEYTAGFVNQLSVALSVNRGNEEEILDRCLKTLRNNMNPVEAFLYLFDASIKEANERPPLHGHHVENLPESSRIKLTHIEHLLKIRLKNDVAAYEEIEQIIKFCNEHQPHNQDYILDLRLGSLKRNPQTNKFTSL